MTFYNIFLQFAFYPNRVKRISKRLSGSFGILDDSTLKAKKVVIRFPGGPYYQRLFAEKAYHNSQVITVDKNGDTLLTLNVPLGFDLINWVLAWPQGMVLQPKELKQQLKEVGRELLEMYN